ncbi:MAG: helix-turn-helix domain-containing protein [Fermentimonas sp.]|nr:helix-turn-helix domain-containing protein [Fermentimonas sp.]
MKTGTVEKGGISITAAFITENEVDAKIKMQVKYDLDGESRVFEAYPDKDENGRYSINHQFEYVKSDMAFEKAFNIRNRIGKRIAEIRKEEGLSQARLAELAGLDQAHIARIEAGRYSVGIDTLAKIGEALGVELNFNAK